MYEFQSSKDVIAPALFQDFVGSRFLNLQLVEYPAVPPRQTANSVLASEEFRTRFVAYLKTNRALVQTFQRWQLLTAQANEAAAEVSAAERALADVQQAIAAIFSNGSGGLAQRMAALKKGEAEALERVRWARAASLPIAQEVERVRENAEAQATAMWKRLAQQVATEADQDLSAAKQGLVIALNDLLPDLFQRQTVVGGFQHDKPQHNPPSLPAHWLASVVAADATTVDPVEVPTPAETPVLTAGHTLTPANMLDPVPPPQPDPEPPPPEPTATPQATDPEESDLVGVFLSTHCDTGSPDLRVKSADLWSEFLSWCDASAVEPLTRQEFGQTLVNLPNVERFASDGIWYRGLALRQTVVVPETDPAPVGAVPESALVSTPEAVPETSNYEQPLPWPLE